MPETIAPEIRAQLEQTGYFSSLSSFIPCHCHQCFAPPWEEMTWGEPHPKIYTCELCDRKAPYCFGAADQHYELCDDCYVAVTELTGEDHE